MSSRRESDFLQLEQLLLEANERAEQERERAEQEQRSRHKVKKKNKADYVWRIYTYLPCPPLETTPHPERKES